MHTERYLPKRYKRDSRQRRRRNRIRNVVLLILLLIALVAAGYFVFRWFNPSQKNLPILTPMATGGASAEAGQTPGAFQTAGSLASASASAEPAETMQPSPSPQTPAGTDAAATLAEQNSLVKKNGMTITERFDPPQGFTRMETEAGSFASYLRSYPLRPDGAVVKLFDGTAKDDYAYIAVADMDLQGSRLQQCADTVLRLNAEYHYARGAHKSIRYHFVSGFDFQWERWRQGERVKVNGNDVTWEKTTREDGSDAVFKAYLQTLYNYASTLSMENYDLQKINPKELAIGDVFMDGGSPGHVVIVMDMAVNLQTGRKCFLLLQGYMPAQDAHILRNLEEPDISPWVMLPENPSGTFSTPEYQFTWDQVMRFKTEAVSQQ